MSQLETLLEQIPIRDNLFSWIMLAGVYLSAATSIFFLTQLKKRSTFTITSGLLFFVAFYVLLDLFLCYTGRMKHVLWLNDSSEFTSFLIAPLIYLSLVYLLEFKPLNVKKAILHGFPTIIYFTYSIFLFIQPVEVKFNAYKDAYHPHLPFVSTEQTIHADPIGLRSSLDLLILLSIIIYVFLTYRLLTKNGIKIFDLKAIIKSSKSQWIIFSFFILMIVAVSIFSVEVLSERDEGDHYLGVIITLLVLTSYNSIINNSKILDAQWISEKYFSSSRSLIELKELYNKIENYINHNEDWVTNPGLKIGDLSSLLNANTNDISRAVNQIGNMNWNDYINSYRIIKAEALLKSDLSDNYSIEGISKMVGFNSKSTFYTAFKKKHGLTPNQWLKSR